MKFYEICVIRHFSGAHRLADYQGNCERLHGHNWKVEMFLRRDKLDSSGLAVDFRIVKKKLDQVLVLLDHQYLNEIAAFKKINPTAENIARFIYQSLSLKFRANVFVSKVIVWESDFCSAAYWEKE
ncbi:MAG: 6-carboxytetrahydropterin synthase QueD [Elusimicrobiota bacterium]